jgi:hypothetical protein
MDDRQSGIRERRGRGCSGISRESVCPGCRRERHSSGACECAGTQQLGQRSERHRQCGQGACDTAAGNNSSYTTHPIPTCGLPNGPGAKGGKDKTNASCGIRISSPGGRSNRQGTRQAVRPQEYKHLQGMLNYTDLILRGCEETSRRTQRRDSRPSFETRARARSSSDNGEAVTQGMRSEIYSQAPSRARINR